MGLDGSIRLRLPGGTQFGLPITVLVQIYTRSKTMVFEGYCVKCKQKQTVNDGVEKDTPNGRKMVQGTCPVCKTKVTRFVSTKK